MFMRSFDRKLNNSGTSLVEVVVALLILAIISVGFTSGFTSAMKSNMKSKEFTYAQEVASNVLETVKYLGAEGVAREAAKVTGAGAAFGAASMTPNTYIDSSTNKFLKSPSYVYELSGIAQGTQQFDVELKVVNSYNGAETPGYNDYQFANLMALSDNTSILINPMEFEDGTFTYDGSALSGFWDIYTTYFENVADTEYENHADRPEQTCTNEDALQAYVTRSMQISVDKRAILDTHGTTNTVYVLNSYYVYSCSTVDGCVFSSITIPGFCTNVTYSTMDAIFVMYEPLHWGSGYANESIFIDYALKEEKDIYIVVQEQDDRPVDTKHNLSANAVFVEAGKEPHLYSQVPLFTNVANHTQKLVQENIQRDRIYDVTITVKKNGDALTTSTTTITE